MQKMRKRFASTLNQLSHKERVQQIEKRVHRMRSKTELRVNGSWNMVNWRLRKGNDDKVITVIFA